MNPPRAALWRLPIALSVVAGTLTVALNVAEATDDVITLTSSAATVIPGEQVTLTARMPVSSAGTVSQEIIQTIDPTKMKLTSVADISYPTGWTLSYCSGNATDCTIAANFSAVSPANTTAWAAVKAVKATGSIDSQGGNAGRQVAQASVSGGSVSQTPTTLPASALGLDGFKVFFDSGRTRVFNLYHHSGSLNNNFDCYVVLTGTRCAGFPYRFGGTTGEASLGVVVGSTAWLGGNDGLYCVDLSAVIANTTNAANGGSPTKCFSNGTSALLSLKSGSRFDWFAGATVLGEAAETKLYALDSTSTAAMVYCIDTATRAACNTPTINPSLVGAGSQPADGSNIYQWGDRLFVSVANMNVTPYQERVTCVLISTGAKCPGFSSDDTYSSQTLQFGKFVPIPSVNGSVRAVCYYRLDTTHKCWEADGTQRSASDYNFPNWTTVANATATYAYGVPTQIGSRVYYGNARWQDPTPTYTKAEVICYDAAAFGGAGGRCNDANGNLTSSTTKNYVNYTVTPDPVIPNCLWITQHSNPVFKTVNILTGDLGCSAIAPSRVTFAGATSVPRMGCSAASAIAEWASFTLVTPATGFTSAKLTVQDSLGANIPGWTDVVMTSGNAVDLSALSVGLTGQAPNFVVDFQGASGVLNASARIKVIGDAPQLCLKPFALAICPSGSGLLTSPMASSMTVSAMGSATDSTNMTSLLNPVSIPVAISAASNAQCGSTLSGVATMSGTSTGVAGATVTLLDSVGSPIMANGSAVTTTTSSDGSYSFGYLLPGVYKVRFDDVGAKTVVSTAVASGGSGTTTDNSSATSLTSNSSILSVGTNGVVNSVYNTLAVATADTSIGAQGAAQTINVKANDSAGTGNNLTSPTIRFCSVDSPPSSCTLTTKNVSGQGSYSLSGGNVVFTPCSGINTPAAASCAGAFTGTATSVGYQITDSGGQSAVATITPSVVPPPTGIADAQTGLFDTNQTYTPASNDTAGSGATLVAASVRLCPTSATSPFTTSNCSGSSVTTADGVYSLNTATGVVTFDPSSTFTGLATVPVRYVVQDSLNQLASTTITPTVTPPAPSVASSNMTTGIVGVAQSVDLLSNDTTPTGVNLTPSSTRLCGSGAIVPNCVSTNLNVPNVGTYSLSGGTVTFTPCSTVVTANCPSGVAFSGTPSAVSYQVTDSIGRTVSSTYSSIVVPPPTAVADTQTGLWDSNVIFAPTSNDSAGSGASLVAVPYGICLNSVSVPSSCSTIGNSIVIPNQGTYSLNTNTGSVTFDPLPSFTGNATAIKYAVSDSLGQKTLATITPSITPPLPPSATSESKSVIPGGSVSFTTLTGANGLASTSGPTFSTSASCLVNTSVIPNTCGTTLTIAGEGVYSLNTGTGVVTFSADIGTSTGTQTPISYRVTDATGQTATSTLTPIVPPRPTANNDYVVSEQNETQVLSPLSNDEAASSTSLDSSSMRLCPDNASAPFTNTNCNLMSLDVADVGRFIVNNDGTVSFTPCVIVAGVVCAGSYNGSTTFTGTAEVRYAIADQVGQFDSAMIRAEVLPPPVVRPANDALTRNFGQSAVFDPLANDSGGTTTGLAGYSATGSADVATSTLKLCGASQTAPHCNATYVVREEGTYTLDSMTNRITFDPADNFVGTPSIAPLYMVCNQIGGSWAPLTPSSTCSTAKITPTILPPSSPSASNDLENGPYNTSLIINVLANDTKDAALSIANSTVKLCTSIQTPPNCSAVSLSSPGEGVYTVDSNTGRVTFTPEASFAGTPSLRPIYQFTDSFGASASAIITPTIAAPEVPIANAQSKVVLPGSAVEFTNVIGTSALGSGTGLRSGAIDGPCLVDPSDSQCKSTFTITGEGTWSIDQTTGIPTFTADPDVASGVQTAVLYRITDVVGQIASAYLTPNVPPNASMTADSGSAGVDINQTFSVLANDTPGNGTTFDSASLRLCDVGEYLPTCTALTVTINGEGTYTIGSNGVVTFNPDPDFAGVAGVISYQVTDSVGRVTSSTVQPTVTAVPPSAAPDTILLAPGQISSFRSIFASGGLVSINAGGVDLDVSSVCIEDPVSLQCATTPIAVAGEGVFSIDTNTGIVSFAAESGALAGPQTVITYRITDRAGNVVQSTLTPIIVAPPILSPDASSGVQGAPQVIRPLVNDRPGNNNVPLVPSSLRLCARNEVAPACTRTTLVIDGEGAYVVNTATGDITFTPLASFSGSATSISYVLDDSLGQRQTSTIALVVTTQDNSGDAGSGTQETNNDGQGQDTTSQTDDHPLPTTGTNIVDVLPWALALIIFGRRVKRIRLY